MQRWKKNALGLSVVGLAFAIGYTVNNSYADTSSAVPGSANDPVVSKSYVDQKVAELVKAELAKLQPATAGEGAAISPLKVVTVPLEKTILVGAGGELIVRTGKAIAVSSDANGLSDMTDGLDIAPGKPVGNNHLILFPRDGRGVKAEPKSKQELIVLVRGEYTLQ